MKKMMVVGVAVFAAMAFEARALSLAEASGRIGEAVADESAMSGIVEQLSASDQVAFLARVNAAIDSMPGAPDEKAAAYFKANKAAIRAAKGNRTALLAETFATVSPEALTVINERFASELFSRNANPEMPTDDDRMTNIAVTVFRQIEARNAAADNADVRNAFAILMFLRASEGSPANLAETLVGEMDDPAVRETAMSEWIPAAMGQGQPKSYEPMLGASDSGEQPDFAVVMNISPAESPVALLSDLAGSAGDIATVRATLGPGFAGLPSGIGTGSGLYRVPRSGDSDDAWYGGSRRGDDRDGGGTGRNCRWICEPGGYNCQLICD